MKEWEQSSSAVLLEKLLVLTSEEVCKVMCNTWLYNLNGQDPPSLSKIGNSHCTILYMASEGGEGGGSGIQSVYALTASWTFLTNFQTKINDVNIFPI